MAQQNEYTVTLRRRMRHSLLWPACLLLASTSLSSWATGLELNLNVGQTLKLPRHNEADLDITIDGNLDETVWAGAEVVDDFTVIDPDSMAQPRYHTEVRFLYSEKGLYAGFDLHQPPDTVVAVLSPRDTGTNYGDFVGITLDTSGEGKYGYWMSLAASGVKTDGTLVPESQFFREWDGAWYGKTALTERGWSAEFFIPWSQLAMPRQEGRRRISLFMSRRVASLAERWSVPALPFTITKWMQNMRPMELVDVNPTQQWSVYPYTAVTEDFAREETEVKAGAEIFWTPSTNFQLSASLAPDFGNVESDDVVVNLSAIETFFPEKRLFFLEGKDIFYTTPRADPRRNFFPVAVVNTRRIGGRARTPTLAAGERIPISELSRPVELTGAIKATGQIGALRYGFLGASEEDITFRGDSGNVRQTGSDYGVARVLAEDSSFGGYRGLGMIATIAAHDDEDAAVVGVDYHYLTSNGRWKLDGQVLRSDKDSVGVGFGGFADIIFTPRRGLVFDLNMEHFDDKLDISDLGFLRRNNTTRVGTGFALTTTHINWAREIEVSGGGVYEFNGDDVVTRKGGRFSTETKLKNLASFETNTRYFGARTDDLESFGNGDFKLSDWFETDLDYFSDQSSVFNYRIGISLNQENVGGVSYKARLGMGWRPAGSLRMDMLAEYVRRSNWLLHQEARNMTSFRTQEWRPRLNMDYFFSANHQFRLSAQWVGIRASERKFFIIPAERGPLQRVEKPAGPSDDFAISNLSLQLRYRWSLAPLSDLFVVYTLNGLKGTAPRTFNDLFDDTLNDPFFEQFVVKLRYRFGS